MKIAICLFAASIAATLAAGPAKANTLNFVGNVAPACSITTTDGTMEISNSHQTLSSETGNAQGGSIDILAGGTLPLIEFSAPVLASDQSISAAYAEMKYYSLSGVLSAYSTQGSSVQMTQSSDSFFFDVKATNPVTFSPGIYTVSTTATCRYPQ